MHLYKSALVLFSCVALATTLERCQTKVVHANKDGAYPLPNPTREFHFSSPQADEGLQTEPFFIILLVFSIFTPPTARTWDMMHIFNFS